MRKTIAGLMILTLLTGCGSAYSGAAAMDDWGTDFETARKQAAERGVPILAGFVGSDWCGWCIRLDEEVFSHAEFAKYVKDHFVLFKADFPNRKEQSAQVRQQNRGLAERYGVGGFPTILLLDSEGKVLARTGYRAGGAGEYIQHLKTLVGRKQPANLSGRRAEPEPNV